MKLTHIRDVLAVAEFGSLRAAGRHLGVAQPAVTRSIHEIERELGVSLFERHARGVRLTAMGQAFVRRAEAVQCELRRAAEEIEQLKGRSTGQVAVALSSAAAIALMPWAMTAFRKRYPDALLKVSEGLFQAVETEIMEGRLDFYVGPFDPAISPTQLSIEKLFDNRRIVVARKNHPLAGARSLGDLNNAEWVHVTLSPRTSEAVRSEADFDEMFERLGLPKPRIVMHARSALITMMAVANSDMLAILPQQWLESPATGDSLIGLQLAELMPAAPICIVRRHDMPLTPMAEYMCDMMRRAAVHYDHRRQTRAVA
jgi:DNA-binding transcriptional LysR family regulator